MVSLTEFVGENPMQTAIEKKKAKAEERLVKIVNEKVNPLRAEIAMYDEMLATLNKHAPRKLIDEQPAAAPETQTGQGIADEPPAFLRRAAVGE